MRWSLFLTILHQISAIDAGSASTVHQDAGICDRNQTCAAILRLETTGANVRLLAGYFISSSKPGENEKVSAATESRILKNTAFKYKDLAISLSEKINDEIINSGCAIPIQRIALTIAHVSRRVAKQCKTTGEAGSALEAPILECGDLVPNSMVLAPWNLVLPSNTSEFDTDGSNFDIFTALLRFAGMESLLKQSQNMTLLLAIDEGMAKTAHMIGVYRGVMSDKRSVLDSYISASRLGVKLQGIHLIEPEFIKFLLGYHFLNGEIFRENFVRLPRSFSTANFLSELSTGTKEILHISRSTPNSRIITGDLKVEGSVVLHVLNSGLIPFETDVESISRFGCQKPSSLIV